MIIRHRTPPGVMAAPISNLAESRIAPMKVQGTLPYGSPGLTGEQGSASSRVGRTASSFYEEVRHRHPHALADAV
jgi:hypothetical protein